MIFFLLSEDLFSLHIYVIIIWIILYYIWQQRDPVSQYNETALELARVKIEYLMNVDPDLDPEIEGRLETLRDKLVALLDDPESLQKIAASKEKPEDGFAKAREGVRNKNVKEWKDG